MNKLEAEDYLLAHHEPDVRAAATILREDRQRAKRILGLIRGALSQVRLDIKYLLFDLDATRRERDFLDNKLHGA